MLKEGQEQKSKNKKDANAIGGKWEEVEKIHAESLQDVYAIRSSLRFVWT